MMLPTRTQQSPAPENTSAAGTFIRYPPASVSSTVIFSLGRSSRNIILSLRLEASNSQLSPAKIRENFTIQLPVRSISRLIWLSELL